MDWQHRRVAQLGGVLQAMDDDALAQLANTGLVRRARKDLETAAPRLVVEGESAFVQTGGQTVTLAALPAECRCDCPAAGLCRHVLAALIFLRDNAPRMAPPAPAREEVLALDEAAVQAWAGKALYRFAGRALAAGMPVEIAAGDPLTMTLPAFSVRCRWVPGAGLKGMLCSCREPSPCEHRAIAVAGFLVREGRLSFASEEPAASAEGAVRNCDGLRDSAGALLREIVSIGLARVSGATVERLQTLSVSAHAADLPRMERLLAALASEAGLHVGRDSQSSVSNLLALAAKVEALACALAAPKPELVGQHRSRYLPLAECELFGAGARQWRTRSGYTGLTVYFWEPLGRRWCTWSAARPLGTAGFSPKQVFEAAGPWNGCLSPREASGSRLRLSGAWRSAAGRLSGRASTTAFTAGPTPPEMLPAIGNWWDLRDRALALFRGGIGEFDEQLETVVLRPARWGPAQYDEVHQRLWRPLVDGSGHVLPLLVPYSEETGAAVRALEAYAPADGALVVGLLRLVDGILCAEPVSVIDGARVWCVTLAEDRDRGDAPAATEDAGEDWTGDEPEPSGAATSAAGAILNAALADMEQTAETGLGTAHDEARYEENAARCEALFLRTPAASLRKLGLAIARAHREPSPEARGSAAKALLHAYYVASLARRLDSIESALAPLRQTTSVGSIPG